jgi:hypothetical protein
MVQKFANGVFRGDMVALPRVDPIEVPEDSLKHLTSEFQFFGVLEL